MTESTGARSVLVFRLFTLHHVVGALSMEARAVRDRSGLVKMRDVAAEMVLTRLLPPPTSGDES